MQWRSARRHPRSHITSCRHSPRACSRRRGGMDSVDARRRRMRWMKSKWCRDECVRSLLERSGARAYRQGAAAPRRVQRQPEHASPPPQHARKTTFSESLLLLNTLRRRGFALDAGFSAASPRVRASHTFHIERAFRKGAAQNVKEPPTAIRKWPET